MVYRASCEILTGGNAGNGYGREREGGRTKQGGGRGAGDGEKGGRGRLFRRSTSRACRSFVPAEIVIGRVVQVSADMINGGRGLQQGGDDPCAEASGGRREPHRQSGRRERGPRGKEGRGRQPDPLARQGRQDQDLGGHQGKVRERPAHPGDDHAAGQGRPDGGHRNPGVPARLPGGHPARPGPGPLRRPDHAVQHPQVRPRPQQRRPVAAGHHGEGARVGPQAAPRDDRRGEGHRGDHQEHHRLRSLHRPGRHRRAAPRHRHLLGQGSEALGQLQQGRQDPGEGAVLRSREGARLAGSQTAHREPLGADHREVSVGSSSRARWSASSTTAPSSSRTGRRRPHPRLRRCSGRGRSATPPRSSPSVRC